MIKTKYLTISLLAIILIASCKTDDKQVEKTPFQLDLEPSEVKAFVPEPDADGFAWQADKFADLKIIRYQVPGWERLNEDQKKLVYYLNQAGLSGRDIMYDQNYRHNLKIRRALEKIYTSYNGDKAIKGWVAFETYLKRIWFSNGIHHHYSSDKIKPGFSREFFDMLAEATEVELGEEELKAIFDPSYDAKKVNQDLEKGLLKGSAVNFYAPDVGAREVQEFYDARIDKNDDRPIEHGLNSKIVKNENGELEEKVWMLGGMYSPAIEKIVYWLEKAIGVAENQKQANALELLVDYYKTGDLESWDKFNIAWVSATEGDIDYINGFVEVYNDPIGFRGSYETIIEITDFDASERMAVVADNVQWFEDNAPLMDAHKKKNVKGVTYKVVTVAGEAGDASPSTPIGVNLPNNNWIRQNHGSKSVSLGNIVNAYSKAGGSGLLAEFANDDEEIALEKAHGELADKLHTALHEVVGHASGQLEPGTETPKITLGSYMSTLEEGRADLVALYFIYDQKLVDLGLIETLDVGKAAYDGYIRNGLMTQLRRLEMGKDVEEAHMRNRQWVSKWVFEKGRPDNVIEQIERDGKTYYNITDYDKLRKLFGDLLREVQRIKSQGDTEAGAGLVEQYGVKVDPVIHKQVLERSEKLGIAPYGGFINPIITMEGDAVEISYPDNFTQQMLYYSDNYSFLPDEN
ncbi:MAG: dihydrofolate reductase [Flavobacteriales bacterium]|nr:dihydrofolate reductase [Flavobacteriales bacterium]